MHKTKKDATKMIHVFSCSFHCVCFVEKKNGRTQMTNIVFFFIVRLGYRSYSLGMDNEICVNRISAIPLCDYHRAHGKWTTTEYSCYFLIHIVDVNVIGMTKFSRKIQSCWCKTTKSICKKTNDFYTFSPKFIWVAIFARHRSIHFMCLLPVRMTVWIDV